MGGNVKGLATTSLASNRWSRYPAYTRRYGRCAVFLFGSMISLQACLNSVQELYSRRMDVPSTGTVNLPIKVRLYTDVEDGIEQEEFITVSRESGNVVRLTPYVSQRPQMFSIFSIGPKWLETDLLFDAPGTYTVKTKLLQRLPETPGGSVQDASATIDVAEPSPKLP